MRPMPVHAPSAVPGPTAMLVLGMHRSGTSALSGTLHALGIVVPGELMEAAPQNPKGFYENTRIVAHHDELLSACGSRWDDPLPPGIVQDGSAEALAEAGRLAALLREEFGGLPFVLVKDPRLCRLVPLWTAALAQLGCRPLVVLQARHPLEVAASLEARNGLGRGHALALWLGHVLAAERDTRDLPRCLTLYEELLQDWRATVRGIEEALGLAWPNQVAAAGPGIDAFLTDELRHHRAEGMGVAPPDRLLDLSLACWEALVRMRVDPGDAEARAGLEAVAAGFDEIVALGRAMRGTLDARFQQQSKARAKAQAALRAAEARLQAKQPRTA